MRQMYAKVDSSILRLYIKKCKWCQTHKVNEGIPSILW